MLSPLTGGGSASTIQLLSLIVPVVALLIVALSVPTVSRTLRAGGSRIRDYFWGPPTDLQDEAEEPDRSGLPERVESPVPDWFDPSIFDEPDPEPDGRDLR